MDLSSKLITSIWKFSFFILATVVKITAFSFHTDSKLVFTVHIPCEDHTEGHCPALSSVCFRFRGSQEVGVTSLLFSLQYNESIDKSQLLFRVGFDDEGEVWLQSSVSNTREPVVDLKITKNASVWHRFCLVTPSSSSPTNAVHAMLDSTNQTVNISKKDSPFSFQFVQDRRITMKFGGDARMNESDSYFEGCFKDVEFKVQTMSLIRYHVSLNSTSAEKPFQYVEHVCVTNETCSLPDTLPAQPSNINMVCNCSEMIETLTGDVGCQEVASRGFEPNLWVVIVTTVLVIFVLVVTLVCCADIVRRSRRLQQGRKHSDRLSNGNVHKESHRNSGQRDSLTCGSIAELEWDPQVENKVKNPELEWDPEAHDPEISDLCTDHLDMKTIFMDENTIISLERDTPLEEIN